MNVGPSVSRHETEPKKDNLYGTRAVVARERAGRLELRDSEDRKIENHPRLHQLGHDLRFVSSRLSREPGGLSDNEQQGEALGVGKEADDQIAFVFFLARVASRESL